MIGRPAGRPFFLPAVGGSLAGGRILLAGRLFVPAGHPGCGFPPDGQPSATAILDTTSQGQYL